MCKALAVTIWLLISSISIAESGNDNSGFADATALEFLVDAAPEKGFNYPYLLKLPIVSSAESNNTLLVETNNTTEHSDELELHLITARQAVDRGFGSSIASNLNQPFLMPVFPRPNSNRLLYTHALDRDSMALQEGPLQRLDLQLLAMIEDAQQRLRAMGVHVDNKVVLVGFSASGTFANRFSFLHPEKVKAVVIGGINAMPMLPIKDFQNKNLSYPLGIADFTSISGKDFNEKVWCGIKQFMFMGELDSNDAVPFSDAYSDSDREIVYKVLGKEMMPKRWIVVQEIYKKSCANVRFKTYEGIGHGTNGSMNREIAEFLQEFL